MAQAFFFSFPLPSTPSSRTLGANLTTVLCIRPRRDLLENRGYHRPLAAGLDDDDDDVPCCVTVVAAAASPALSPEGSNKVRHRSNTARDHTVRSDCADWRPISGKAMEMKGLMPEGRREAYSPLSPPPARPFGSRPSRIALPYHTAVPARATAVQAPGSSSGSMVLAQPGWCDTCPQSYRAVSAV